MNGVAVGPDGEYVVYAESMSYAVTRLWLKGPRAGQAETLDRNLPGFPGNLTHAGGGVFWMTFLSPRNGLIDRLDGNTMARRFMGWLPKGIRPRPQPFPVLARLDLSGPPAIDYFAAADGAFPSFSAAIQVDDKLYLSPAGYGEELFHELWVADAPARSEPRAIE